MELITVARFLTSIEAELLRMRLEREGVFCNLANLQLQNTSAAAGGFPGASVTQGAWLQVRAEDVEQAQAILSGASTGSSGSEEAEQAALEAEAEAAARCPNCGGENVEYAEKSPGGAVSVVVGVCAACGSEWRL